MDVAFETDTHPTILILQLSVTLLNLAFGNSISITNSFDSLTHMTYNTTKMEGSINTSLNQPQTTVQYKQDQRIQQYSLWFLL